MDLEKIYDRLLLLIVALAAIVFSVIMILKSSDFVEKVFPPIVPVKNPVVATDAGPIGEALDKLHKRVTWVAPVTGPKTLPLAVSTHRILRDGQIFDISAPEPKLRPPLPNTWILQNKVSLLRKDVLEIDEDKDGFSNLEEYHGKTNPYNGVLQGMYLDAEGKEIPGPKSHPPLINKLSLVSRSEQPYKIEFRTDAGGQYNIKETELPTETGRKRSVYVREGEVFFDRFEIIRKGEKTIKDERVGEDRVVPFLIIQDKLWGDELTLEFRDPLSIPFYFAKFSYHRFGNKEFEVRRGDAFAMNVHDEAFGERRFRLDKVTLEEATLVELKADGSDGKTHIITRGKVPAPQPANSQNPVADPAAEAGASAAGAPASTGGPAADAPAAPVAPGAGAAGADAAVPAPDAAPTAPEVPAPAPIPAPDLNNL